MTVRVLIVDDQWSFRRAARTIVALTEGFEVVGEAESGEDSVEAARALSPDLVLMDVNLTGIDGFQARRRILAGSNGEPPVVLLLSIDDADELAARHAGAGPVEYLPKTEFGPAALVAFWKQAGRH